VCPGKAKPSPPNSVRAAAVEPEVVVPVGETPVAEPTVEPAVETVVETTEIPAEAPADEPKTDEDPQP